jgi:4-amino-4-deoxy-L-arabinose transferase-like glycosyltransferase
MKRSARRPLVIVGLWAVVVAGGLAARPAWPIDETRYLSVAWEMWERGDLLVPHLNGIPYSDKGPLLFWFIQAGWGVFGVHEWWPRVVPSLFALARLFLTARLGRRLWPDRPEVAYAAPLLLLTTFLWSFYSTLLLFDMLLVFFALLGVEGLLRASKAERGGWTLVAISIGLGILAKGPAILIWILPAALAAPWWSSERIPIRRWYTRALAATASGLVLALAWAAPAALSGGRSYADAILWNQTAGRLAHAFAHQRPFWWYVPFLPLFVFPWLIWLRIRRSPPERGSLASDRGLRLCAVWSLAGLAAFSFVSGKQIHYLLPLLPPVALAGARLLSAAEPSPGWHESSVVAACFFVIAAVLTVARWPGDLLGLPSWISDLPTSAGALVAGLGVLLLFLRPRSRAARLELLAACSVAALVVMVAAVGRTAAPSYDVSRVARYLGRLEQEGHPLAHVGKYRGEYQFAGRLKHPLEVIEPDDVERWFSRHPDGYIVVYSSRSVLAEPDDELRHDFRGGMVAVRHRFHREGSKFKVPGSREAALSSER